MDDSWFVIIDPEPTGARLAAELRTRSRRVDLVSSARAAQRMLAEVSRKPACVLLETQVQEGMSLRFLPSFRHASPFTRFLIVTAYGSIASAVQALRLGADDYRCKPLAADVLLQILVDPTEPRDGPPPEHPSLDRAIWEYIQLVLAEEGSIAGAARRLRLQPRSLRRMLQKLPPAR